MDFNPFEYAKKFGLLRLGVVDSNWGSLPVLGNAAVDKLSDQLHVEIVISGKPNKPGG